MLEDLTVLFARRILHHTWAADGATEDTNLTTQSWLLVKYATTYTHIAVLI